MNKGTICSRNAAQVGGEALKIPNADTGQAIQDALMGENLHSFDSPSELSKALKAGLPASSTIWPDEYE
ncbi:hypothetical protein [Solidesulfovibrio carbinoliphilus]|uniref:hypothetical protein n=1 Tax=Solidesulfovibrio carbinoliphilus TaxID=345370 RepID=UPI0012F48102|nr:hypothetical protein [Solidesulfovibrio carbinoliphilus]